LVKKPSPSSAGRALGRRLRAQHVAHAAVVLELERETRVGERDAAEHLVAMPELGRVGAQEFAARRGVEIEVGDRDRGALRARGGLHLAQLRALGGDRGAVRRMARAAGDRKPRHRSDRRERLAAEAHGRDALEVLEAGDLAGGVPGERERQLAARDAGAVVLDLHALDPARVEHHADRLRARVDAVLEQLLQHRGRSLDHFSGRDLAHQQLGKHANGGHAASI
jgi:hypothetical protein